MKGTIIGSDFLEHGDSVKLLEMNTNTTFYNQGSHMLDYDAFFNVLLSNNISELHFIYTESTSYTPVNDGVFIFEEKLIEKCAQHNISYHPYSIPANSVTVPYIEDNNNRFILRQSYDTTALVDETYCADKFELLALLNETELTPKTYFSSNILNVNQLNELPITPTNTPNIIIKERNPLYDINVYPSLHRVETFEELTELKTNLRQDLIIQEFIYDESNLVENRWAVIRSIDIIYGPNLDIINLGGYKTSSVIPIDFSENTLEENSNRYNQKTRYKYINKAIDDFSAVTYHLDNDSNILMADGSTKDITNILVNDIVKSVEFTDLNGVSASADDESFSYWEGTFNKTVDSLNDVNTNIVAIKSKDIKSFFIRVTLENNMTWVESPVSTFYFEENNSTSTRWDVLNKMVVGDKLIIKDTLTNELLKIAITDLSIEYFEQTVYELDVEPYDTFLSDIGNNLYTIMHNNCDQCGWMACGTWGCASWCGSCIGEVFK